MGLAGGINTYAYVLDNPLRWTDPNGEALFDNLSPWARTTLKATCFAWGLCTKEKPDYPQPPNPNPSPAQNTELPYNPNNPNPGPNPGPNQCTNAPVEPEIPEVMIPGE